MLRLVLIIFLLIPAIAFAFMPDEKIAEYQKVVEGWPLGDRIAFWAEQFLDTPYDPDPLGVYVREKTIVSDEKVDCMYLTFRSLELALSMSPSQAVEIALDKRFKGRGVLDQGRVANYEDRFAYGEDMVDSGKWGREITREIGENIIIRGSRGTDRVSVSPKEVAIRRAGLFQSGDIIFFVRDPRRRTADEIIGHIGIVKKEHGAVYLIHAGGTKNRGGKVKKTLLADYLKAMPFIGIRATRLGPDGLMPE